MREKQGEKAAKPEAVWRVLANLLKNPLWALVVFVGLLITLDRLAVAIPAIRGIIGVVLLVGVLLIGLWTGLIAALVASAVVVAYVWVIYRFPSVSPLGQKPEMLGRAIVASAIIYPLFAAIGGMLRAYVQRSTAQAEAARREAEQRADRAIQDLSENIRDLGTRLEERVAERTRHLEAANEELLGFTYSVSHDLRAPLRAIVSNSRLASIEGDSVLDGPAKERLQRLEASALKMEELIESLLQYAQVGHLSLSPRNVDVTEMATRIGRDLGLASEGTLSVEPGLTVRADPELLELVLLNLLENSWKYVKEGQRPVVQVGKAEDGAIFVRDQGIGFDMKYAQKIWEPFERLHSSNDYPGTGIGLANAKRIIERHGGSIWTESVPGRGTTMYFTLAPAFDGRLSEMGPSAPVL